MFKIQRVIAAATMLAFCASGIASAQSTLTLYQGAQINAKMRSSINTANANVGDRFVMDVVPPYPSANPAFAGATIVGEVIGVTRAGRGQKAALNLRFDTLRLADGSAIDIAAHVATQQKKKTLRNGATVALATIGGMLLGNAIGKTIFHTSGGGIVGAAGGFLYGYNEKSNFSVPAGSLMAITLNQTVTIRRQAGP